MRNLPHNQQPSIIDRSRNHMHNRGRSLIMFRAHLQGVVLQDHGEWGLLLPLLMQIHQTTLLQFFQNLYVIPIIPYI